jgi:hypothetical protein
MQDGRRPRRFSAAPAFATIFFKTADFQIFTRGFMLIACRCFSKLKKNATPESLSKTRVFQRTAHHAAQLPNLLVPVRRASD